jgi:2-keto-4-pentenoate hydratase/2-oxohepta-3-ene-1,7-dioic acid hydratase in catechol pathway
LQALLPEKSGATASSSTTASWIWAGGLAFGPWMTTRDEVPDVSELTLTTTLNGQIVQQGDLSELIFNIPSLVNYCSRIFELLPGDVIVTGTTGGVGARRTPPLWLKPGDRVTVEITGVGILGNEIVAE